MKKLLGLILGMGLICGQQATASNFFGQIGNQVGNIFGKVTQSPNEQQKQSQQQTATNYQRKESTRLTDKRSVEEAQYLLSRLGYKVGVVDGVYGKKTAAAIMAFQRRKGLYPDGFVTQNFLDLLAQEAGHGGVSGSNELAKAQQADRKQGTIIGGITGAVAGIFLSDKMGVKKAEGAAIGGAAGAGIGYLVGNETAERRGDYAQRYDEIDNMIQEADKKIASLESQIKSTESSTKERERQITMMQARARKGADITEKAKLMLGELDNEIALNKNLARDTRVAIKTIEKDIADIEAEISGDKAINPGLKQRHNELVHRRDKLLTQPINRSVKPHNESFRV